MKKVKYETGSKKDIDAFFDENLNDHCNPLQNFAENSKMSPLIDDDGFTVEPKRWTNYLKQALLFLPGTFLLFFTSLGTALAVTDPFSRNVFFSPLFFLIYSVAFLAVFMTWFGLGDIKNKKHFAIPASIMLSGAIIGVLVRLSASVFWIAERIIDDFGYAVYLFPIGLIAPVLAKDWVERKSK